jgi:hypothetical protein
MGILHIDTGGSATNSGSSDNNAADLTGIAATAASTVISLDGSPNLSALNTSGANQSSILLQQATNTNRKIFWITAFDNVGKTVTVDAAPTGITSSAWAIGGRHLYTRASIINALRAGDIGEFNNSPASSATNLLSGGVQFGDSVSGQITLRGKAGTRPVITCTSTPVAVQDNGATYYRFENLEIAQQGASGNTMTLSAALTTVLGVKVSDGGAVGISISTVSGQKVIGCEVTGVLSDGINTSGDHYAIVGNYLHDNQGDGLEIGTSGGPDCTVLNNICDTNIGRGIFFSSAIAAASTNIPQVYGNTVYGNGNSGLEVTDQDLGIVWLNNVLMNNGGTTGSGAANVKWAAGAAELVGLHKYNLFYQDSTTLATGAVNLSGVTADATELTSDPLFVDGPNANFALKAGSPAIAAGFPGQFLDGPLGYLDMGAVQYPPGGIMDNPGMAGGMNG